MLYDTRRQPEKRDAPPGWRGVVAVRGPRSGVVVAVLIESEVAAELLVLGVFIVVLEVLVLVIVEIIVLLVESEALGIEVLFFVLIEGAPHNGASAQRRLERRLPRHGSLHGSNPRVNRNSHTA